MDETDERPITFEDLGVHRTEQTTDTVLGQARQCSSLRKKEVLFLSFSLLALIGTIGLTFVKIFQYAECYNNTKNESESANVPKICEGIKYEQIGYDFTLSVVIIVNAGFCILYVIHGVIRERPYEMGIFLAGAILILLYAIINISFTFKESSELVKIIKLVRLAALGSMAALFIPLGIYLARDYNLSGNLIFRTIGSNAQLQKACKILYGTFAMLKLDAQLAITLVVLILHNADDLGNLEIIVLSVGLPFSLAWLAAGFIALRSEIRWLTYTVLAFSIVEPGYVIYRMYLAGTRVKSIHDIFEHNTIPLVTLFAGLLALLVRAGLDVALYFCLRSYGLGLKEKMKGRSTLVRTVET